MRRVNRAASRYVRRRCPINLWASEARLTLLRKPDVLRSLSSSGGDAVFNRDGLPRQSGVASFNPLSRAVRALWWVRRFILSTRSHSHPKRRLCAYRSCYLATDWLASAERSRESNGDPLKNLVPVLWAQKEIPPGPGANSTPVEIFPWPTPHESAGSWLPTTSSDRRRAFA